MRVLVTDTFSWLNVIALLYVIRWGEGKFPSYVLGGLVFCIVVHVWLVFRRHRHP